MTIATKCVCGFGGYCNGRKECTTVLQSQPQEGAKELKRARQIVEENFKGLSDVIDDFDILHFYKELIVTCMLELSHPETPIQQPVKKPLSEITDEDAIELCCSDEKTLTGFEVVKITRYENAITVDFRWIDPDITNTRDGYAHYGNGVSLKLEHLSVKKYQYLEHRGYDLPRYYPQPVQPVKEGEETALSETLLVLSRLIRSLSMFDSKYELEPFHKKRLDQAKYVLQKYSDPKDALRQVKPSTPQEPVEKWVSVEDRLPEFGEKFNCVQVLDDGGDPVSSITEFDGVNKIFCYPGTDVEQTGITHWMPLPQPPKQQGYTINK